MTYGELKKCYTSYMKAEKEYKSEAEKHFPTTWNHQELSVKPKTITKEEIRKIANLRKVRDDKEKKWHEAMIEYSNSRK